ncbi:hypothetical protein RRG08_023840 [Elysia crispata]|uniref:Uncharacterized protein n=1 Tax=Elysia crispata TaxID=231223 RepID=A0AAE1DMR9_9GAST|nr:hypothetical protein RRG08_023840 [Elysia crispata]
MVLGFFFCSTTKTKFLFAQYLDLLFRGYGEERTIPDHPSFSCKAILYTSYGAELHDKFLPSIAAPPSAPSCRLKLLASRDGMHCDNTFMRQNTRVHDLRKNFYSEHPTAAMKNCIPLFLATISIIHFSHIALTSGFPENYEYLFDDDYSNGTNVTTITPGSDTSTASPIGPNDTTQHAPGEDTTSVSPSSVSTTSGSPITTGTHSPPKTDGSKGSSFDGASFAGGIALGIGVLIIVGIAYTIYRKRATKQYNAM